MSQNLRNILIAAGALVVLVLLLPFLIPMDSYRVRIEAAGERATGRTMRIEGPLRLTLFPRPGLKASRVTLANVPGGRAAALARVGDVRLAVRILPLLAGRIALDKIILDKPAIALEVDAAGNANWQFAKQASTEKVQGSGSLPSGMEFSGIEVHDGRITYDNAKTGTHRAVEEFNADVAITHMDRPAAISGDLVAGGQRIEFEVRTASVSGLVGNGTTDLGLSAKSDTMQARFKGALAPDGGVDGTFKLDTSSFRSLAAAFGESLPGKGFNALSLESLIVSRGKVTRLDPLRLTLDGQHIRGHLLLDRRAKTAAIEASLTADRLNLDPYLASGGGKSDAGHARPGWSRTPFSFALLKQYNGQIAIQTGALRVRDLKLGKTSLKIALADGALTTRLDPVSLYGGTGRADIDVDARGTEPVYKVSVVLSRVSLRPFLTDALGVDSIEGSGALKLSVLARGNSVNTIAHSLAGTGSIAAEHGRFRRVDMGLIARSVQTVLSGGATGEKAQTDFHGMGGTFTVKDGVLANNDFHLSGPVVQMTGKGLINIGGRGIDFRLTPSAGVGGMRLGVPFRVKGSWDDVHYAPDLSDLLGGVMKNIEAGRAPLKDLLGGKKGEKKNVGETLKDVFGLH